MTSAAVQIVMLTDEQLLAEIVATEAVICCPSYTIAARNLCGCKGGASEYWMRLHAEAVRRADERAAS